MPGLVVGNVARCCPIIKTRECSKCHIVKPLKDFYTQRAYYKNIFIDSLNSDKYFIRKPISVTIERFENVYLATNYDLDIYGYGDSEAEALDELKSLILEFFEDLKDEKDLAPVPKKMMAFYIKKLRRP